MHTFFLANISRNFLDESRSARIFFFFLIDALDNVHIKIYKQFYRTFFHTPRLFWWSPFFPKRESVWYDGSDDEKDEWNYKLGDIVTLPLNINKPRLFHQVEITNLKEADKITDKIKNLKKIKGGWFGFP